MAPSRDGRRETHDYVPSSPSEIQYHSHRGASHKSERDRREHHTSKHKRESDRGDHHSPSRSLERGERSDRKRSRRSRSRSIDRSSRDKDRKVSHRSRSRERDRKDRRSFPRNRSRSRSNDSKDGHRSRSRSRDRRNSHRSRSRSGDRSHRSHSRDKKELKGKDGEDGDLKYAKAEERMEEVIDKRRERERDAGFEAERIVERSKVDNDMEEEGEIHEEVKVEAHLEKQSEDGLSPQMGEAKKLEPLSLEEILKKKKEEALQQAKPVFLTKAQRAELAIKRRQEEVLEQRKREQEQRKLLSMPSESSRKEHDGDRDRSRQRDREREHERERDRERREREREREEEAKRERVEKQMTREREKELEAIKEQYLGAKKLKKRVVKPSEKFRFSFDWENTEDTSRDMNPIYQNPHEAQLLFGRGFRAGMDRREQKKLAAKNEKDLRAEIRAKDGVEERPEEAEAQKQKEEAANVYDTFDMRVDRHWSEKKIEEMTERDWRIFREDFNISYKGSRIPRPMRNWEEGSLSPELLKAVAKAGYKKPSPIQMAAIPIGLQQRDVIGIAETGSGKTAAFVLPMLTYISKLPPMTEEIEAEGPYAVVMAPTRELAQQIEEETVKFAHYLDIRVVSIVGGQSIEEQGFKLRQGCEIVIATPGRLLDCLERRYAVLNQCNYVVLDEADRMIDMGFEPQVVGVLDAMPSSNLKPDNEDAELDEKRIYRTTYMFSATMPPAVERLARKYLRNPVVVTIGTAGKATDLITQHVMMLKDGEKLDRLQRVLNDMGDKTAIIFVNTKKSADSLSRQLDRLGYRVTTLHGGKTQEQREISLEGFRNKRYNCLVATDVAGRGIDIPDVAHVLNFDMPNNIEQYTHRIGRTGRAGKTGIATTFLTLGDTEVFYDLKQMLMQSNSPIPPELSRHEASKFKPGTVPDRPPRRNDTVYAH
ncbi:ATP-dependent RNA helicase DDX23/PRP28 [Marchantia polymorpha subsp. ruderalis]